MYDFSVRPKSILFVCTGNTCRSPMAECLAREIFPDMNISSAGLSGFSGSPASEGAKAAMEARGFSLANHRSQAAYGQTFADFDLIIPMTSNHKKAILAALPKLGDKVFTLGELVAKRGEDITEIDDPYGLPVSAYVDAANTIELLLFKLAAKFPALNA